MKTRMITALLAAPVALMSVPALAQPPGEGTGFWHYGWDWGWGHTLFGSAMMVLFWGGLIALVVLAVRWFGGRPSAPAEASKTPKQALEILRQRFARGEIEKADFEERSRLLSQ